ncbi:DNA repair endonuclease XPF [Trichinella pseudospiralis]|uniref:DNA repair endonuclease XPF n=1 Tax=Trichinella pseudospiralis TaxID=6337 RepID=A0A0V1IP09_TRIPS|nr:DNA repair endonuclease XPF [Trichinella pseudospiralis]KRZ24587.1 DNA repair endonuclease XPF [Trichinella pseudospiralis]KRZ31574.1 DNA repair endonuclease XPF [Trichinella pseudospiralis]
MYAYLQYENDIFVETFSENFLLIAAKGLCVERLFVRYIELYSDPSVLVIVLGTDAADHTFFSQLLREFGSTEPTRLTSNFSVNERQNAYLAGGVKFVTTNILINDLLAGRIPVDLLTGILVYRAQTVLKSALDAFLLREIIQRNTKCFVKAFSDQPSAFAQGIGKLQRAVSLLQVDRVRFLPRFHINVINALDKAAPDLQEVTVNMSDACRVSERLLNELLTACVQELRQCNTLIPLELLTVEMAATSWFDSAIQSHFGVDLQDILSSKACLLLKGNYLFVKSSKVIKHYAILLDINRLRHLIDCLESESNRTFASVLTTMFSDKKLFHNNSGWLFTEAAKKLMKEGKKVGLNTPNKWLALVSIIQDLYVKDSNCERKLAMTFLLVRSRTVGLQLKQLLQELWESDSEKLIPCKLETDLVNVLSCDRDSVILILHTKEKYTIFRALLSLNPDNVVIYNADMWTVRHLELYNATACSREKQLRVFFMMYDKSMEERKYLSGLQRERTSFEQLFKEEVSLLIPKRSSLDQTRLNELEDQKVPSTIVVDMREFRSELPTQLHVRGVRLVPVTLTVGDYIITPDVCVERKSINDLISSLIHGRLYAQCRAMNNYYKKQILLIQLGDSKKGWHRIGDQLAAKLACLTLNFPKLSIIWAMNALSAAELLIDFKWKRNEPNANEAVAFGKEEIPEEQLKQGQTIEVLRRLPSVDSKNIGTLLKESINLKQLFTSSQEELEKIVGNQLAAKDLYTFINEDFKQKTDLTIKLLPMAKKKDLQP